MLLAGASLVGSAHLTGGAGFIGSAVVDLLVAGDHEVVVMDCLLPAAHRTRPDYLNPDAEYRFDDLRDVEATARAVLGVDAVCHQASMVGLGVDFADVVDYVDHNDRGTAVLVPDTVPEITPPDPRNVYAASKLHQEHLVAAYAREHDSPWGTSAANSMCAVAPPTPSARWPRLSPPPSARTPQRPKSSAAIGWAMCAM